VKKHEAGYNLVILVIAITVLNIMVAAAIPLWRTAIRREKEEELIFRGLQYAEGLRLFQQRQGRLPSRLEELVEVKPRCMRKLWEDPITGKRDWVPIRVMVSDNVDRDQQNRDKPGGGENPDGREKPEPDPGTGGFGAGGFGTVDGNAGLGPIRGVRSRSKEEAIKVQFNQNRYDQWQFTVDVLLTGGSVPQNVGGVGIPGPAAPRMSAKWIGRPMRQGLQQPGMPPPQKPLE
jgi:type II secretory pathway pseudopilin PulG